ncbi:MAG TPA: TlpA disulfide reductase family protein [Thermoanaerobaculia bacterium]|nr:TlpA disulfide reductase family protein [Thermoanaerobaculia bacterium]
MRTERALLAIAALVMLAVSGCTSERSSGAAPAAPESYRPVALTAGWQDQVRLVPVTHEQWLLELEALEGRIVVVDNWATWCAPCIERFPAMVELAGQWSPRGVTFVSLSLDGNDGPESIEQVSEFLRTQDARIPNYLMDEVIPDAFEKLGLLGIPAVFIYDASGEMTHRLTGDDPNDQFTEADVEEAIRSLVGQA